MKEEIDEIVLGVLGLPPLFRAAFVLAVSERTAPVFHQLATQDSVGAFDGAMDAGWSLLGLNATADRIHPMLDVLNKLPEADSDDSHSQSFYAMISLHILAQALGIFVEGSPDDRVRSICFAAADLYAECGGNHDVEGISMIGHDEAPEPDPLELLELRAQQSTLRMLQTNWLQTASLRRVLRQEGNSAIRQLIASLPHFAAYKGWTTERDRRE